MSLKNRLSSISKNGEAKTLAGNFAWLSALQIASYVFPLITMPYLARVIGVDGFGKIAFASAIMVWIQTIADWGFNLTATRDVAQNRDNPQKVSEIFSNVLWARCLLMLLSFVMLILLLLLIPKFRENSAIILVTFLMIPGHILFPDWFFQAIEKMKYITILNVLMKFIFTVAVFLFIKTPEDYILQPLFTSLGYVVCGIIALYYILKKWGIKLNKPNWHTTLQTIKGSTNVFINNLAPNLYGSFSIVILGFFGGGVATGIFEGGNKFYHVGYNFMHIFIRTFFPFLSRAPHRHKQFAVITSSVVILFALIIWTLAPWLVDVMLSEEFQESVGVIRILSLALVFWTIAMIYGQCSLVIHKQERIVRNIAIISSIVGFCAGWPLIYYFSYLGAALTALTGKFTLCILTLVSYKRINTQIKQL